MAQSLIQAYRQAPWRKQIQGVSVVLVLLVGFALVSGLYLSVSAQSTAAGMNVQNLEDKRDSLKRDIADKENTLALNTSAGQMRQRAIAMGFQGPESATTDYLVVKDYSGRPTQLSSPFSGISTPAQTILRSEYTLSLWELLNQSMMRFTQFPGGG